MCSRTPILPLSKSLVLWNIQTSQRMTIVIHNSYKCKVTYIFISKAGSKDTDVSVINVVNIDSTIRNTTDQTVYTSYMC